MKLIPIILFFVVSLIGNAQESSFKTVTLTDKTTIELPKSWISTTNFNQNFDEQMEAFLDGVDPRKFNINPTQNKAQLLAAGKFINNKASVIVTFINTQGFGQNEMARMSAAEKLAAVNQLEETIAAAFKTKVKVNFEIIGNNHVIHSQANFPKDQQAMEIYQIPSGDKIVQFQFLCSIIAIDIWTPIFLKVVRSYSQKL